MCTHSLVRWRAPTPTIAATQFTYSPSTGRLSLAATPLVLYCMDANVDAFTFTSTTVAGCYPSTKVKLSFCGLDTKNQNWRVLAVR